MSAPINAAMHLEVDDAVGGYRLRLALESPPPPYLTLTQVVQMIVQASQSVAAATADGAAPSTAPTHHKIGNTAYTCSITPLSSPSPTATAAPDLLPGSFSLQDTNGGAVASDTTLQVHQQRGARLQVVRHPADAHSRMQSGVSSSAVFFIETDNEGGEEADEEDAPSEQTAESVSFHEDMISMTYQALFPSGNATSAAQSVQFETEDDDEVELDTISFATTDTTETRRVRRTAESSLAPTPNKSAATAASATSSTRVKRAGPAADPVANMTARQRFEYYQARGSRKKTADAPSATQKEEKEGAVAEVPALLPPPLSIAASSTTGIATTTKKKVKKSAVTGRKSAFHPSAMTTAATATGPAVSAPAAAQSDATAAATAGTTEREVKLVEVIAQLQEDVQRLLQQSHTDASRIAALRGALTETQRDYRALHDAHCTSLSQLNAYAAQMAAGVMPQPCNEADQEEEEQEVAVAEKEGEEEEADVQPEEPQPQQQQQENTAEGVAETAEGEGEGEASPAAPPPTAAADAMAAAPQAVAEKNEAEEETGKAGAEQVDAPAAAAEEMEGDAADADAPPVAAAATKDKVEAAAEAAAEEEALVPAAPLPALFELSETELRSLLKQLGHIHHNRLLRRENALLMYQLYLLHTQATTSKRRKSAAASGGQRLRVVVRIRPVGLAATTTEATAAAQSAGAVQVPPAVLPSPGTQTPHNGSVRVTSPFDRSVGDGGAVSGRGGGGGSGGNPLAASSVVSPLLSPHSVSLLAREHAAAVAAVNGTAVAPSDVFLHCDAADSSLQVRNPELLTTTRDKGASVRGVRIIGPPVPQSLFLLPSSGKISGTVSPSLLYSVREWDGTTTSAGAAGAAAAVPSSEVNCEEGVSALRVAAALEQRRLYDETVAPLVERALRGESGTVISYGQVGSGKTYTMFGDTLAATGAEDGAAGGETSTSASAAAARHKSRATVVEDVPDDAGVIPRALADLFARLRDNAAAEELLLRSLYASRHDAAFQAALSAKSITHPTTAASAVASASSEASLAHLVALARVPMCEVQCSLVELYNDKVRDLLAEKIEVPIYEEFLAASHGVKGSAAYRSSSAERRTQLQLRQAQAAQQQSHHLHHNNHHQQHEDGARSGGGGQRQSRLSADESEQRRVIGHAYVSPECAVHPTADGGVRVSGATHVTVRTAEEAVRLLRRGQANRETHATASNAQSSRSHVIFTVTLKQQQWWTEEGEEEENKDGAAPQSTSDATAAAAAAAAQAKDTPVNAKAAKKAAKDKAHAPTAKKAKPKMDAAAAKSSKKVKKRRTSSGAATTTTTTGVAAAQHARGESVITVATTAAEVEEQEHKAQEKYLRRRTVRTVTSRLVFVDLAGTDRGTGQLSGGDPDRLREAQSIGKGLAALGDVMSVLYGSSGSGKLSSGVHVPFRSHKLTMLLRDALVKPTSCVVLACIALSEAPMTALLSDINTLHPQQQQQQQPGVLMSSRSSASAAYTHAAAPTMPVSAEKQYWRTATERFMAVQRARSTTVKRVSDATTTTTAAAAASASRVRSPTSAVTNTNAASRGGGFGGSVTSSRLTSARPSVQLHDTRKSVSAVPSSSRARKVKSTSKSVAVPASSRLCSTSLEEMQEGSYVSEDGHPTGRTSEPPSPAVRQLDASSSTRHAGASVLGRSTVSRHQQQQQESEVRGDPETVASFEAIQASAEAEERAVAGALFITPRETLSTLIFLSRLWKA